MSELPEGWTLAPITAVFDLNPPKPPADVLSDDAAVSFVPMAAVDADDGVITSCSTRSFREVRRSYTAFRNDDVILAKITPCFENGKAAIARNLENGLGFGSSECFVFRPTGVVLPEYLFQYLRQERFREAAAEHMTGTAGQERVPADFLRTVTLPIPPLAEQRRIVARIEALIADANEPRKRLTGIRATLRRLRQATLAAACAGRLTEDWRVANPGVQDASRLLEKIIAARARRAMKKGFETPKSGTAEKKAVIVEEDLYDVPASWYWARWDDPVDWITYGFTRPMPHVPTGIPIVTARHISNSRIECGSMDYTTKRAFDALSEKDKPRKGEILITKDGSIGRAAMVREDCPFCINQSVAVLRFGGLSGDPEYLLRAIESPWTQHLIDDGAKGSAIRHISITAFGRFPVPRPPLPEQGEIVRRAERLFAIVESIERQVAAASTGAERLADAVLAKAFRGELVTTEAELARQEGRDYESAAVLLERITTRNFREAGALEPRMLMRRVNVLADATAPGIGPMVESWDP